MLSMVVPLWAKEVYNTPLLARVLSSGNANGAYFVNVKCKKNEKEKGGLENGSHEAMLDFLGQHLVTHIQLSKCRSEVDK